MVISVDDKRLQQSFIKDSSVQIASTQITLTLCLGSTTLFYTAMVIESFLFELQLAAPLIDISSIQELYRFSNITLGLTIIQLGTLLSCSTPNMNQIVQHTLD